MKVRTLRKISAEIDEKREEMILTAQKYGYIHQSTIKSSQDLDLLINEYLEYSCRKHKKNKVLYDMARRYCARIFGKHIKISI